MPIGRASEASARPAACPTTGLPAGASWYVVYTRPLREEQTAVALGALPAVRVFYPTLQRLTGGRIEREPLFLRYLFIGANLAELGLRQINSTQGVCRLVTFDDTPMPLPDGVVEALHQRVEQLNRRGGLLEHGYQPGERVALKSGPLRGLDAIFQGPQTPSRRVRVLVEFLGQLREVEVEAHLLERAAGEQPRGVRGTRGGGRRIASLGHSKGDR